MSSCGLCGYRRHQLYVVYEADNPIRGRQKLVAAVNHYRLFGIKAIKFVRRLLRLFTFNCRALHPDRLATSVHDALLFREDMTGLEDISPITTHVGLGLDNALNIQVCSDEIVMNQMNDEMISIVDLTKEDDIGYCFMNIANGCDVGNPLLSDLPCCSPLSAEEYAFVYWEEDEELGHHDEEDADELLEWFAGQRVLSIHDVASHWPSIANEFYDLYGPESTGGLAPWRRQLDSPSYVFSSPRPPVVDLQRLALDRVVRVYRRLDVSRGHMTCIPRECSKVVLAAFARSGHLSDDHLRQFLNLKTIMKEIRLSRCHGVRLPGLKRVLRMSSKWLTAVDVSWLDCVNDDVVNLIVDRCCNLKMLLANGCRNIRGVDLGYKSLAFMDYGQNVVGIPMDIYVFYKDPRRNKIVLGKLRHRWLFGRSAVHFADRLIRFCDRFEEPLGDYESFERYIRRLLCCDPEVPYFHEGVDIVQESIVPDPRRYWAHYVVQNVTPFFLHGGGAMTPAGKLSLVVDVTNRDEMLAATRSLPSMIDALIDPEPFFGLVQTGVASIPPRYAFVQVKPGKKNSLDVYSASEYLRLFYPDSTPTIVVSGSAKNAAPKSANPASPSEKGWRRWANSGIIAEDLKRLDAIFKSHPFLDLKQIVKLKSLVKKC